MYNKFFLASLVLMVFLGACTKKITPAPEPAEVIPEITIHEPSKDHYDPGAPVLVHVTITDSKEMHEAKYWMIAQPQQDTLWSQRKHVHSKTIVLESSFQPPVLPQDQRIEFTVWAENSDGKTAVSKHVFEVH